MDAFSRRALLKSAGLAGAAVAIPGAQTTIAAPQPQQTAPSAQQALAKAELPAQNHAPPANADVLFLFNEDEAKFVRAAVDRIIPADDKWGGADAAGVLYYIDHQLASAWGAGATMYLDGPWNPQAPPQQGYQLKYTPAQLYQVAIGEIRAQVREQHNDREFWELKPDEIDKVLSALESGDMQLPSVPSPVFFETLLANTLEGYFADPAYGGNRNMVSWRMVGFPGAFAQFIGLVDQYDYHFVREPVSIASSAAQVAMHEMHE